MFTVDFITDLPLLNGYNNPVATFVDIFTKQAHFMPCSSTINARDLARVCISNVYRLHGLSTTMIGDKDKWYTSQYFKSLLEELGTTLSLSTAAFPRTDYQTEFTHTEQLSKVLDISMLTKYIGSITCRWQNYTIKTLQLAQ
jgi:hypothetical protein